MHGLAIGLTIFACLVLLVWMSRHVELFREISKGFVLTDGYVGRDLEKPMISVLVAARDEEKNIETCVRTMLEQDYPSFEIIVCNDRSTDRTGEIVRKIAEEDSRVRIVDIDRLPEGWMGKSHAMFNGIAASRGEYICMIDADCRQTSKRTLSVAIRYMRDMGAGMLSILPVLENHGFWESVIQPICGGIMMVWFKPDKVNNPAKRHAYANGAFIMMNRQAYQAIGTHEAIKGVLMEDMQFARMAKDKGLGLRVVRSRGLYLTRMYTNFSQIIRGWTRIFFGTFHSVGKLAVSIGLLLFIGISPYLLAIAGFVGWFMGLAASSWWLACGCIAAATIVIKTLAVYLFYRVIFVNPLYAPTYLLGCLVAIYVMFAAMLKRIVGGQIIWRGTAVPK